jgi:hypothetical protein
LSRAANAKVDAFLGSWIVILLIFIILYIYSNILYNYLF